MIRFDLHFIVAVVMIDLICRVWCRVVLFFCNIDGGKRVLAKTRFLGFRKVRNVEITSFASGMELFFFFIN